MVSGPALVVAIAAGLLIYGGSQVVTGAKKLGHAIAHVVHHKKPASTPTVGKP